jgi:D-alanyl-D-alanine carboxypeptidase
VAQRARLIADHVALSTRQVTDAAMLAGRLIVCLRHAHGAPGVAFGVRHEGMTVLLGANGMADLDAQVPVDVTTTRFRCASITKTFTATLLLRQVERGRLRLDDAVGDWLPWTRRVLDPELTLRHLVLHGGGIIRDGSNAWDDRTMPDRAMLRAELERSAAFGAPSERFRYSNMGFALLGEVLEKATSTSFSALLRREIARPLGLAATDADLTVRARRSLATGYYAAWPGEPHRAAAHVEARAIAPAGGLVSTVGDLLEYQDAQLPGDGRLLSEVSKREMQRPQWQRSTEPHYGLGWMCWHAGPIRLVGHSGGYPGFTTKVAFAPEERLSAAVLTNGISPVAAQGLQGIYDAVAAVAARWGRAGAPSRWHTRTSLGRFGGVYRDNFGTLIVGRLHQGLLVVHAADAAPFAEASLLMPRGPLRFNVADGDDFGFLGEDVRFLADRRGRVTTLVWGAHPYARTEL